MQAHIYINGALIPENEAAISPLNPGFLFGEGLFETIRADHGAPFMLPEHLERLHVGLKKLDLEIPRDFAQIGALTTELLAKNQLAEKSAAVKIICTAEASDLSTTRLRPATSLIIRATALNLDDMAKRQQGMRARLLPWRRDRRNPLLTVKSLNYLENRHALNGAKRMGFDEAIFLNQEGELCEGTFSNLFLLRGQTLMTPPPAAGILPGITRAFILHRAQQAGIACQEIPLFIDDLKSCDGAFITSSLMLIAPLTEVEPIIKFNLKQSAGFRKQLLDFFI